MRKWALLILLSACAHAGWTQSVARTAADASKAVADENYMLADSLYSLCLQEAPNRFDLLYNAALVELRLHFVDSALSTFETALTHAGPEAWKVHYNTGNCLLAQWIQRDLHLEYVSIELEDLDTEAGDISDRLQAFLAKDSLLALQGELLDGKMASLEASITAYKASLLENPLHDDARYNLLWAKGKIPVEEEEEEEESVEKEDQDDDEKEKPKHPEMEAIKKAVFDHIKNGDFPGAYAYLAEKRDGDESLSSLDDLLDKLEFINEILQP